MFHQKLPNICNKYYKKCLSCKNIFNIFVLYNNLIGKKKRLPAIKKSRNIYGEHDTRAITAGREEAANTAKNSNYVRQTPF